MIKISKELKVGVAVLFIMVLFYWGFNYLKGKNFFNGSSSSFYTTYNHVNGLKKASPVLINGYTVGSVVDISFNENGDDQSQLVVEFTIEEDVNFSKTSTVEIYSSLMGGKSLVLVPGKTGESAVPGDYLKGKVALDMMDKLGPIQHKAENTITSIDKLAKNLNTLLDENMVKDLHASIHSLSLTLEILNKTTSKVDALIATNQKNLNTSLSNLSATSENFKAISDSLAQVKILSISKKLNTTLANLEGITTGMQNGEGTLGKLTKDEALYNNLESASKELEELLKDVKEHPKRFVQFSLFGKKEVPYKETEEK